MENYWTFLSNAMHEMRKPIHALGGFLSVLKDDELHPGLTDDERYDLFLKSERSMLRLTRQVNTLADLTYYGRLHTLPKDDRVLINDLCREVAGEYDIPVRYKSDIPDYYALMVNGEVLRRVIDFLVGCAVGRVLAKDGPGDQGQVYLIVTERGEPGQLTFSVSDNARRDTPDEVRRLFTPPTEPQAVAVDERMQMLLCRILVRLMGGFIYISDNYDGGRRVIFSIAQ